MIPREQLMLSDYVSWDGEIVQIVELRQDWCIVTKDYKHPQIQYAEVRYDELEAVELTLQMLEDSGFEEYNNTPNKTEAFVLTYEFWGHAPELIIRRFDFNEAFLVCDASIQNDLCCITYVHEFQNLLRLLFIKKEIQL